MNVGGLFYNDCKRVNGDLQYTGDWDETALISVRLVARMVEKLANSFVLHTKDDIFSDFKEKTRKRLTLFKTDSTRAGCFACQNKNPSITRWKISFRGFRMNLCRAVSSSDFSASVFGFPNCPAELRSATPITCSGNPAAATKAVKPPRLKIYSESYNH